MTIISEATRLADYNQGVFREPARMNGYASHTIACELEWASRGGRAWRVGRNGIGQLVRSVFDDKGPASGATGLSRARIGFQNEFRLEWASDLGLAWLAAGQGWNDKDQQLL
jgi:hypothetical protein